ncbi:hypothetical protein ACQPW1_22295 [Nocardia sp. CA-128927]|uniref:hypothetical protein n=1 Tax=Nocardia sp. CA-128927 TaxID=3239975 RepID=UPI003D973EE2
MMYWYEDGPQWWMFVLMILVVVPLWITAAVAIIAIGRSASTQPATTTNEPTRLSPEALLAERFASGDVDESEYLHRRAVLCPTAAKPVGSVRVNH